MNLWPSQGLAEDTYNFYFVKDKNSQSKEQENSEKDQDSLSSKNQTLSKAKKQDVEKKTKAKHRQWVASLGVGSISSQTVGRISDSFSQTDQGYGNKFIIHSVYNLGVRYNWSRYFDFHGNLLLPQGEPRTFSGYYGGEDNSFDFQLITGLGTTPFHFYFLDFPFLEIGLDASFVFGDPKYTGGNSVALVLGPRVAVNFTRGFSTFLHYQQELFDSETLYSVGTWGFSYRW